MLASVGQTGAFVWTINGGAASNSVMIKGSELMRVCWAPDGNHVLTGSAEGAVQVCSATDGAVCATLEASKEDEVYGLEMLSSEGLLAVGAGDEVQHWDLHRATRLMHTSFTTAENGVIFGGPHRNPEGKAYVLSFATRGRALCAALSDGTVRLLDSQTLQEIGSLDEHAQRSAPAFCVAVSETTPMMASSDSKGHVLLWDLRQVDRGPLAEANHGAAVHSLAFVRGFGGSQGKELLATGCGDRQLRMHTVGGSSLAVVGSVGVTSELLCVKAAPGVTPPLLASGGGGGGIISDAGITLWQLEPRENDDADAAQDVEDAGASDPTVTCCPTCCDGEEGPPPPPPPPMPARLAAHVGRSTPGGMGEPDPATCRASDPTATCCLTCCDGEEGPPPPPPMPARLAAHVGRSTPGGMGEPDPATCGASRVGEKRERD